jgi:hypothetical protein
VPDRAPLERAPVVRAPVVRAPVVRVLVALDRVARAAAAQVKVALDRAARVVVRMQATHPKRREAAGLPAKNKKSPNPKPAAAVRKRVQAASRTHEAKLVAAVSLLDRVA